MFTLAKHDVREDFKLRRLVYILIPQSAHIAEKMPRGKVQITQLSLFFFGNMHSWVQFAKVCA